MFEAINTVLAEFKTLSPDITSSFVFKANGEAIAQTQTATPEQTQTIITQLSSLTHAQCIGGVKNLIIRDVSTQLTVTAVEDVFLATVSRRTSDEKVVRSLTRVVVPLVIRLALDAECRQNPEEPAIHTPKMDASVLNIEASPTESALQLSPAKEVYVQKSLMSQLMIEKISGLLVPSDTVRIDSEVIANWQEVCGDSPFSQVCVETLEGKRVICKFKPQKDAKPGGKGLILVPEKLIQALGSDRGQLVLVKPILESEDA